MAARIKSISVSGIRTLDNFKLDLDGLTVLIGQNGSGKSTIVEACELLRRLTNQNFFDEFNQIHGGESLLLRRGAGEITIGMEAACGDSGEVEQHEYQIRIGRNGISSENLWITPAPPGSVRSMKIRRVGENLVLPQKLKLALYQPAILNYPRWCISQLMQNIRVHVPFASTAYWLSQSQGGRLAPMRDSVIIAPTDQLDRFGGNLPNAYSNLKNEQNRSEWDFTMELVRLGLGQWVESVNIRPDAGGGKIALWIKIANSDQQIPSASLSEGQLAYLAIVALARLPTFRSLLVFDEIETHLHPRLLPRVIDMMGTLAEQTPVLLTTHSRRVLDDLDDPAKSVGVLELDEDTLSTKLQRLDESKLKTWLDDYEGLGKILDAGYPETLFQTVPEGR